MGRMLGMKKMDFNAIQLRPETARTLFREPPTKSTVEKMNDENEEFLQPIKEIEKLLRTFYHEQKEEDIRESREVKWKYASLVLDKLFFYLSLIYFVVTFFPLIFTMVNFYKPI